MKIFHNILGLKKFFQPASVPKGTLHCFEHHFQNSCCMLGYALKADRKKDVPLSDVYQKIGMYSYEAGNDLLKGEKKLRSYMLRQLVVNMAF